MLPRPELCGPVADGQSAGQLHRRLRRAGLPDIPAHRKGATADEAGHATAHQDDSQAAGQTARHAAAADPRGVATHEHRASGAGRFRHNPTTRATDLDPSSNSAAR